MKEGISAIIGMIGSAIVGAFGGWDASIATLTIFMGIDFITGLVCAGVFHKSKKTDSGALESKVSFKGLCKKGMIILYVLIAARLDILIGSNYIRNAVVICFIVNELISITENAGLMGLPLPEVIVKAIAVLEKKANQDIKPESEEKDNDN